MCSKGLVQLDKIMMDSLKSSIGQVGQHILHPNHGPSNCQATILRRIMLNHCSSIQSTCQVIIRMVSNDVSERNKTEIKLKI